MGPCMWSICHSPLLFFSSSSNTEVATSTAKSPVSFKGELPQQVLPSPLPTTMSQSCSSGMLGSLIKLAGPPQILSLVRVHPIVRSPGYTSPNWNK